MVHSGHRLYCSPMCITSDISYSLISHEYHLTCFLDAIIWNRIHNQLQFQGLSGLGMFFKKAQMLVE